MVKHEFSTETSIFQSLNHQEGSCLSFQLIRQRGEILGSGVAIIHSCILCIFAFRSNFIHLSRETGPDKFQSCVGACSHKAHSNKTLSAATWVLAQKDGKRGVEYGGLAGQEPHFFPCTRTHINHAATLAVEI